MHVEVSVALNFVISYLYNKLPRRRVDMMAEELEKGIKKKFEGHWYPDKPFKGSGFRCIRVNGEKMDPVIIKAVFDCGLQLEEIKEVLPMDLMVWIDPSEVSYRIGEKGVVKVLYSDKRPPVAEEDSFESLDKEIQAASKGFNPEAQSFKPIDSLSSSLNNLSLSPSSPTTSGSPWGSTSPANGIATSTSPTILGRNSIVPQFTTATFAQTKFGSTKLKSCGKRPSRLSPTELGASIKQRTILQTLPSPQQQQQQAAAAAYNLQMHPLRPRNLSPRDPRQEFFDHQHRLFLAQQSAAAVHQAATQLSPSMLSPMGGGGSPAATAADLYASQALGLGYSDLLPGSRVNPMVANTPSPDGSKAFLDSQSPYANLQHAGLLVAN